jgi:hypothetical protein
MYHGTESGTTMWQWGPETERCHLLHAGDNWCYLFAAVRVKRECCGAPQSRVQLVWKLQLRSDSRSSILFYSHRLPEDAGCL